MNTTPTLAPARPHPNLGRCMTYREFCIFRVRPKDQAFLPPTIKNAAPAEVAEVPTWVSVETRHAHACAIVGKRLGVSPDTLIARYVVTRSRRVER